MSQRSLGTVLGHSSLVKRKFAARPAISFGKTTRRCVNPRLSEITVRIAKAKSTGSISWAV